LPKQAWIESSLVWFTQEFGGGVLLRDTVVPAAFIAASYAATADQVSKLVRRVRVLMGVGDRRITLDLFDGAPEKKAAAISGRGRAVGHYREAGGRAVVALDLSEAGDAAYMTAIIAHELSHVLLLGDRRISAKRPDNERLTDLLTVFFGFGIFTANAALRYSTEGRRWLARSGGGLDERTLNAARHDGYSRLGYLTEQEFGYALACYCRMRGDLDPPWRGQLDLGPRGCLEQGLSYLSGFEGTALPVQRLLGTTFTHGKARVRVVFAPAYASPVNGILAEVDRRPL